MTVTLESSFKWAVLVLTTVSVAGQLCMLFDVPMLTLGLMAWCTSVILLMAVLSWSKLAEAPMNVMPSLW